MPSSYEYTGLSSETEYNFRVTVADNAGNTNNTGTNVTQTTNQYVFTEADAGKIVNYTPKAGQTYSTTQNGTEYSGYSKQDFSTSDLTGTWSLWGVDDQNIYVIADNATTKKLYLTGVRGYNNGVTLLDNICDTVFTDKTTYPNMKGQNLKLEQVLAVTTVTNNYASKYNTAPYSYSFKYPYIWNQYEKSQANSQANRSTAYALTTQDALTSNVSAKPYFTLWYNTSMNTSSAWKNAGYFRMVMTPAQSAVYWLSSRCVYPNTSSECYFGLQFVYSSGVNNGFYYLYHRNSNGSVGSGSFSRAVRPLVSFPTSTYRLKLNGEAFDIIKN